MNEHSVISADASPLWLTACTQSGDVIDLSSAADCQLGHVATAVERVSASDLKSVANAVRRTKSHSAERGQTPPPIVADIRVHISSCAAEARANARHNGSSATDSIFYVGTPPGLASLIADIHTLAIAEGVHLIICDRTSEELLGNVIRHLKHYGKHCGYAFSEQCLDLPALARHSSSIAARTSK